MLPILAGHSPFDMSKIAGVLGKTRDQAKYAALAEDLAKETIGESASTVGWGGSAANDERHRYS